MPSPPASEVCAEARSNAKKTPRALSCTICQQRKVKCDRKFPCGNCVKAGAQQNCIPASLLPRQRRRRFPERELLDRIRRYEDLLRQHNIQFESLHPQVERKINIDEHEHRHDLQRRPSSPNKRVVAQEVTTDALRTAYEAKDLWNAADKVFRDYGQYENDTNDSEADDEDGLAGSNMKQPSPDPYHVTIRKTWDATSSTHSHLLFGLSKTDVDLSSSHPKHAHIFKLWQLYVDNVNPLLKVIHIPSMQSSLVDAVSDMSKISPELEALMFSIYCVSVSSLTDDDCVSLFGVSKEHLLTSYQFAAQQALLNCDFLRSCDRNCLTALHLFLITFHHRTDHLSHSSMHGLAIRLAQHMGLHDEAFNAKCSTFESEMRRRLWWSMALYENRIGETSQNKMAMLAPNWNCQLPLNVNDSELQPEMKSSPTAGTNPTEAIFAVVRSKFGDCLRHSPFHLNFTYPSLKPMLRDAEKGSIGSAPDLDTLERILEDQFKSCMPENPLHFVTMWFARSHIAKAHLLQQYCKESGESTRRAATQRNTVVSYALRMLECDTKLTTSPLTQGYQWLIREYFPFPAYSNLILEVLNRSTEQHMQEVWKGISANYEARFMRREPKVFLPLDTLSKTILQAWTVYERKLKELGRTAEPTPMILHIKMEMMKRREVESADVDQNEVSGNILEDAPAPVPMDTMDRYPFLDMGEQNYTNLGNTSFTDMPGQLLGNVDLMQLDWSLSVSNAVQDQHW